VAFAAKKVCASVLFTDIRYFNKIVNILSLEEIHSFLNDCFAPIVETVLKYEGTIDKFMGDAVMAVFGSSISHNDDSFRAVKCALDIQQKIEDINVKWRKPLDFLVEIDIGICTGEVLAGNVGHVKRMDYTVIGKNVNLAAQLVHMCNAHNVEILIDGQTYEKTKDDFVFKEVGEKLLLGFIEPVMLYSPKTTAAKKEI
jgi:adenylate cyclase